jgi:chromatin remodeling complex protein RSC6
MAKKSAKKSAKTARKSAKKTATTRTARASKGAAKKSARTSTARKSTRGGAATGRKKSKRQPNPAFMQPLTPSPALAEVVGAKPLPRTEATSRLWAYIKKNDLQDSKNRRMIKADPALKAVFGGKSSVNMFEMTKLVSKHLR